MKQVIPFYKEIVFKNKIANLTSISLEHNEKVVDGEVSGEFIVYGDYKVHNDTTEKEEFKYKLPFTALLPDDIDLSTVKVDITDFKYDQIDEDVLRIDIDFSIEGDEVRCFKDNETLEDEVLSKLEEEGIDKYLDDQINEVLSIKKEETEDEEEPLLEEQREEIVKEITEHKEEKVEMLEEYVTYHVHIVGSNDSVENIMKLYNTNLDMLNQYNDIKELKVGDKVIIPEYNE